MTVGGGYSYSEFDNGALSGDDNDGYLGRGGVRVSSLSDGRVTLTGSISSASGSVKLCCPSSMVEDTVVVQAASGVSVDRAAFQLYTNQSGLAIEDVQLSHNETDGTVYIDQNNVTFETITIAAPAIPGVAYDGATGTANLICGNGDWLLVQDAGTDSSGRTLTSVKANSKHTYDLNDYKTIYETSTTTYDSRLMQTTYIVGASASGNSFSSSTTTKVTMLGGDVMAVSGGGHYADANCPTEVYVRGGIVNGYVAGGCGAGTSTGSKLINIIDGSVAQLWGGSPSGGATGKAYGDVQINISGGEVTGQMYLFHGSFYNVSGNGELNISGGKIAAVNVKRQAYSSDKATLKVSGSPVFNEFVNLGLFTDKKTYITGALGTNASIKVTGHAAESGTTLFYGYDEYDASVGDASKIATNVDLATAKTAIKAEGGDILLRRETNATATTNRIYANGDWLLVEAVGSNTRMLILAISISISLTASRAAKAITEIASGRLDVRVSKISNDEVGNISVCVNSMAESLQKAFAETDRLYNESKLAQIEVIAAFSEIVESKSGQTGSHVKRVAGYTEILALAYGMSAQETEYLKVASMMHDIGKLLIPPEILEKTSSLTNEEYEIIKKHTIYGEQLLRNAPGVIMAYAKEIALNHHERWDGKGYPNGKSGDSIPICARIVAIADAFDAITSKRSYKEASPASEAFKIISAERGKQFDPQLVDSFLENNEQIQMVYIHDWS